MRFDDPRTPAVSCILPTYNRRAFLPHALHYFLRQDYPNTELLVVDDGPDAVGDLVPDHPRIRYLRLPSKITLGAKLNLACENVSGSIIAQWDDDDWYAPSRLTRLIEALVLPGQPGQPGAQVSGLNDLIYYDIQAGRGYRYVYPRGERPWLLGSSLCFRRELWEKLRFADIDVGMDGLFVWATEPDLVRPIADPSLAVHLIHQSNVSPKAPNGAWWTDYPVEEIARIMGDDWRYYQPGPDTQTGPRTRSDVGRVVVDLAAGAPARPESMASAVRPVKNVYACLVHESPDCVVDLVQNLRRLDPDSSVLLYNGGSDAGLLVDRRLDDLGAIVHPAPRPMRWGYLHPFALDCMRFATQIGFDTMTVVDSDQLAIRPGWSATLAQVLTAQGSNVGLFGKTAERQPRGTTVAVALTAWQEYELWRPYVSRFADGETKFGQWTFWPSTVFTADACRELLRLFDHDAQLADILRRSQLWATEEILLPTLVSLLGFRVLASPGSYDYLRYRVPFTTSDVETACSRPDVYWIHPVARIHDDAVRTHIRHRLEREHERGPDRTGHVVLVPAVVEASRAIAETTEAHAPPDEAGASAATPASIPAEVRHQALVRMRGVEGWLSDSEADLLVTVVAEALGNNAVGENALVEVGSFCGKATTVLASVVREVRPTARIWAIDPHDGVVGAVGQGLANEGPTLERFQQNMASAGLSEVVETVQSRASDTPWSRRVGFLLVDGLHDYHNVAKDFRHFEPHIADGALIAFHDYANYFPGVVRFVDELVGSGRYSIHGRADTMIVLRPQTTAAVSVANAPSQPVLLAL